MEFVNTFSYHRENSSVSLDAYVNLKRNELGAKLSAVDKIYLDTKYWIYFRDVVLGRCENEALINSYKILESLCSCGKVICPISEDVFYEITKQTDKRTLSASLELIDDLSSGISLISQEDRIRTEVLHFLYRYSTRKNEIHPLKDLVWTKICYTVGLCIPQTSFFSKEEELVVQKSFFDQMWHSTLADVCDLIGYDVINDFPRIPDISDLLNENAENARDKRRRFKEIFMDEVYFTTKYMAPMLSEAMEYMYETETGKAVTDLERSNSAKNKLLFNTVVNIFRLGKEGTNFPTLKVGSGIHAAVIVDKKRCFEANDYYDFRHAQAAVPYCDYFFTEKNLKHLLMMNALSYDKEYNCEISSKPKDVLGVLTRILEKSK